MLFISCYMQEEAAFFGSDMRVAKKIDSLSLPLPPKLSKVNLFMYFVLIHYFVASYSFVKQYSSTVAVNYFHTAVALLFLATATTF